jgi:hypothetical protein
MYTMLCRPLTVPLIFGIAREHYAILEKFGSIEIDPDFEQ